MFRSTIQTAKLISLLTIASFLLGTQCGALAQTKFLANFDNNGQVNQGQLGPSNLINQGWTFRVQTGPNPLQGFVDGFTNFFTPMQGPGYLASNVFLQATAQYASWAILPPVNGQVAGDPLTFWIEGLTDATTTLEARYSPNGGTNTGNTYSDVGDFTTALVTVKPISNGGWQPVQATIPGNGRIAIRILGKTNFNTGPYVGIDQLSVGVVPPLPCNLPPIPAAGQTVTWTLANSPYVICTDISIPKGGTAIVEPGVQVHFQAHTLAVSGTLTAQGQAATHISLPADDVFPPAISMFGGTLNIAFADIGGQVRGGPGKLLLSDSTFSGDGSIFTLDIFLPSLPPVISLTRCTFNATSAQFTDSYVILKDSNFVSSSASILRGYLRLQGTNTFDGKPLSVIRETMQAVQPLSIDGVVASNVTGAGGLSLSGGNFLLGSKNVLQANLYPLDITAGLLPGSVVPLTGNTNNMIWAHDGSVGPVARWANLKLPYLVDNFLDGGGKLTIDAGVKVLFDPTWNGFAGFSGGRLVTNGLPNSPIILDAFNPAFPWDGILYAENHSEGNHLDYVSINHAKIGVIASDGFVDISNALFQKNQIAMNANTFGYANLSKSRVLNNATGLQTTELGAFRLSAVDLSPNWFQGNTAGVQALGSNIPAQNNYWGAASGPKNPNNPAGQGDSISGDVTFKPFLTAPPDFTVNPPVVRMVPLGNTWTGIETITRPPDFVVNAGEKLILRWTISNSSTVSSQRILLSPQGPDFDSTSFPPIVMADNLPAATRSLEVTIPSVPFAATNLPQFLRIVAIDAAGQQGWDQTPVIVPDGSITGSYQITSDYSGKVFIGAHARPRETWTGNASGGSSEGYIFLETNGGLFTTLPQQFPLPMVSTDAARQVVISHDNSNALQWFFSSADFSIRPDPGLGIKAPVVQMTSPTNGQSFAGGSTVPIRWTASAQQSIRSFDIQYSANGGETWHFVAQGLGSSARSFDWALPASTGISDVRVRVIVRDGLFQDSSNGRDVVFSITP
jgi:hypothetical protein